MAVAAPSARGWTVRWGSSSRPWRGLSHSTQPFACNGASPPLQLEGALGVSNGEHARSTTSARCARQPQERRSPRPPLFFLVRSYEGTRERRLARTAASLEAADERGSEDDGT